MPWHQTPLTDRLGIRLPLIQAPMAGGPTTPELVAAVSAAGGLGCLSTGYQTPDQLRAAIARVRTLTDRPFGANVLVTPPVQVAPAQAAAAEACLAPYRAELGLAPPSLPEVVAEPCEALIEVLLEARVRVVTFAFGLPDAGVREALREAGAVLMGTATTVAEARWLEAAGMAFVIAQGAEAGGHRGTFLGDFARAQVGTLALVPQVVDAVGVPVIAAGGVMDGRGIVAARALGAAGVQMGSAFMLSAEAGTSAPHRAAIRASTDESTCVTAAFTGKPVRAIANRFTREQAPHEADVPPYPVQHLLTRDLRRAATQRGDAGLMGMWAGQASALAQEGAAADLMARWVREADAVVAAWA